MLDHGALPAGVWEEILPFLGLEPDDETRARARAYGAVNAKDAGRTAKLHAEQRLVGRD